MCTEKYVYTYTKSNKSHDSRALQIQLDLIQSLSSAHVRGTIARTHIRYMSLRVCVTRNEYSVLSTSTIKRSTSYTSCVDQH